MKIQKGHYVPKELITSEALHEAVVKVFVAAGFKKDGEFGNMPYPNYFSGLGVDESSNRLCWTNDGEPLTLQQLFTAENGLQWTDFAVSIQANDTAVWFCDGKNPKNRFKIISSVKSSWHTGDGVTMATRHPKEKEVNKVQLIDKAIIKNSGVWPCGAGLTLKVAGPKNNIHEPFDAFDFGCTSFESSDFWIFLCERKDFERRAKELGYINGCRWGAEYPTNGKRPDLPDDVEIEYKNDFHGDAWVKKAVVNSLYFENSGGTYPVKVFRITDPRYKPADVSYLNVSTQAQSLTHKRDSESVSGISEESKVVIAFAESINKAEYVSELLDGKQKPENVSGFVKAAANKVMGEMMKKEPIGTEKPDISDLIIALSDASNLAVDLGMTDCARDILTVCKTVKDKSEREKVIEAADSLIYSYQAGAEIRTEFLNALYDAGMLVLPQKKSDTKG